MAVTIKHTDAIYEQEMFVDIGLEELDEQGCLQKEENGRQQNRAIGRPAGKRGSVLSGHDQVGYGGDRVSKTMGWYDKLPMRRGLVDTRVKRWAWRQLYSTGLGEEGLEKGFFYPGKLDEMPYHPDLDLATERPVVLVYQDLLDMLDGAEFGHLNDRTVGRDFRFDCNDTELILVIA